MASGSKIARALAKLTSLRDEAASGVREIVACGPAAIPPLRELLFCREPSGLYEPRRRAVEALADLGAYDTLAEYLSLPRAIADPVEGTGEQAVINVAARALAAWRDPRALPVLSALVQRPPLPGVIDALAKLQRREAIPYFIAALAEDTARPAAENALRSFGTGALEALRELARPPLRNDDGESPSHLRARRSALALLLEIVPPEVPLSDVESYIRERDPTLAVLGCRLALMEDATPLAEVAIQRLISLIPDGDSLLRLEIEDCLAAHFMLARAAIARALRDAEPTPFPSGVSRTLRHVIARASGHQGDP